MSRFGTLASIRKKLGRILQAFLNHDKVYEIVYELKKQPELNMLLNSDSYSKYEDDLLSFKSDVNEAFQLYAKVKGKKLVSQELARVYEEIFLKEFPNIYDEPPEPSPKGPTKRAREENFDEYEEPEKKKLAANDEPLTTKTKADFKEIIQKITKNPDCEPFLYPVDSKSFPEYYESIKHPMDFSTIKKKLQNEYMTVSQVVSDIRLIWKNCIKFNVEDSEISITAQALAKETEKLFEEKFGSENNEIKIKANKNKDKESDKLKLKEESVTPGKSSDKKYKTIVTDSQLEQLTYERIKYIIKELKKYECSSPFLEPVTDEIAPDYSSIVKQPMDLTTIHKKFKSNSYADSVKDFISDMNLIWNNCILYNDPKSDIALLSLDLKRTFEFVIEEALKKTFPKKEKESIDPEKLEKSTKKSTKHGDIDEDLKSKYTLFPVELSILTKDNMILLVKKLQEYKLITPFLFPVDVKSIPGYLQIISKPMDIETVENNIEKNVYFPNKQHNFLSDVRLIWNNCMIFNAPDSDIYNYSLQCAKYFEDLLKSIQLIEKSKQTVSSTPVVPPVTPASKASKQAIVPPTTTPAPIVPPVAAATTTSSQALKIDLKKPITSSITTTPSAKQMEMDMDEEYGEEGDDDDVDDDDKNDSKTPKKRKKISFRVRKYIHILRVLTAIDSSEPFRTRASPDDPINLTEMREQVLNYQEKPLAFLQDLKALFEYYSKLHPVDSDIYRAANYLKDYSIDLFFKNFPSLIQYRNYDGPADIVIAPNYNVSNSSQSNPNVPQAQEISKPHKISSTITVKVQLPPLLGKDSGILLKNKLNSLQNRTSEGNQLLFEYIQSLGPDHSRAKRLPIKVYPGLYEIYKLGELSNPPDHCVNMLFPKNYLVSRVAKLCLVKNDDSNNSTPSIVPFVSMNLLSTVEKNDETNELTYIVKLDNGTIVGQGKHPREAWANIFGKEMATIQSIGHKLRRCKAVLNRLCISPDSIPFLDKVSTDSPETKHYYDAIKAPMWLREVDQRLKDGVYDNEFDFSWDMRLIFQNCKEYNTAGSPLYKEADRLSVLFESLFSCWILSTQDRSVDDLAKGEWNDWYYLKCFDCDDPNRNFCTLTGTEASKTSLLQCAWCENQYLPASLNLPNSKASLKTWACNRCRHALELCENDMTIDPFINGSVDYDGPYSRAEFGSYNFVPALDIGPGWFQAKSRKNKTGFRNLFLSPLGYEVTSKEDIALQNEYEESINTELKQARIKEFQEQYLSNQKKATTTHGKRRRGNRANRSSNSDANTVSSEVANAETQQPLLPIDNKYLEEEGRILNGKLFSFELPDQFSFKWFCLPEDNSSLQEYQAAMNASKQTKNAELPLPTKPMVEITPTSLTVSGFFGLHMPEIRRLLEGLENATKCKSYLFVLTDQYRQELIKKYESMLSENETFDKGEIQLNTLLTKERWSFHRNKLVPMMNNNNAASTNDNSAMDIVEETTPINEKEQNKIIIKTKLGFKPLVSENFPFGGLDTLLSLWDFLDSAQSFVGLANFTLSELVSSVLPPPNVVTTTPQIVFDEANTILLDHVINSIVSLYSNHLTDQDKHDIYTIYPINILTWPSIAESIYLLLSLPLTTAQFKNLLLNVNLNSKNKNLLKLIALIWNQPLFRLLMAAASASQLNFVHPIINFILSRLEIIVLNASSSNENKVTKTISEESDLNEQDELAKELLEQLQLLTETPFVQEANSFVQWCKTLFNRFKLPSFQDLENNSQFSLETMSPISSTLSFTSQEWDRLIHEEYSHLSSGNGGFLMTKSFSGYHDISTKFSNILHLSSFQLPSLANDINDETTNNEHLFLEYFTLQMKVFLSFEKALFLFGTQDTEMYLINDRLAVYLTSLDFALNHAEFQTQLQQRGQFVQQKMNSFLVEDVDKLTQNNPSLKSLTVLPKGIKCQFTGLTSENVTDAEAWTVVPAEYVLPGSIPTINVESDREEDVTATGSRRKRKHSSSLNSENVVYALKEACSRFIQCRKLALEEQQQFESKIDKMIPSIPSYNKSTSVDVGSPLFYRSKPVGYDQRGNSYWVLTVQQVMTIFPFDTHGRALDRSDASSSEPCILLRDQSGFWFYHNGSNLLNIMNQLNVTITCERMLKYRLFEMYYMTRNCIQSILTSFKPSQSIWIDKKINIERWLGEQTIYNGTSVSQRNRQLEMHLARVSEIRTTIYYFLLNLKEEIYVTRIPYPNERELLQKRLKRIKDNQVDASFEYHSSKGWMNFDIMYRIRQLSMTTINTRIHADPSICSTIQVHLSKSTCFHKLAELAPGTNDEDGPINPPVAASSTAVTPAAVEATPKLITTSIGMNSSDVSKVSEDKMDIEEDYSMTEEKKSNRSSKSHAIEQLHLITGEVLRIYPTAKDAASFLEISQSSLSHCLNGMKIDAYGFRWRYYDGPPIDWEAIKDKQTPIEVLRTLQRLRGRPLNSLDDNISDKTPMKKSVSFTNDSKTPAIDSTSVAGTNTSAVTPSKSLTTESSHFSFSSSSQPKTIVAAEPSLKPVSAKLLKLKCELFNILFSLPEKANIWPELDAASEQIITETGGKAWAEASAKCAQAIKDGHMTQEQVDIYAEKQSRKARRRLRRNLARDRFVRAVQDAVTPNELFQQVIYLEASFPPQLLFKAQREVLPTSAITTSDVAWKIFALDRTVALDIVQGLDTSNRYCPMKLRVEFAPRCAMNATCSKFLGHSGKCIPSHANLSRYQIVDALTPPSTVSSSAHPTSERKPAALPAPIRRYEESLPKLAAIQARPNPDIEAVIPYVPNHQDIQQPQWV